MRILVLSDLPPDVNGGAEHQALKLCAQWLRSGHEIRVIGHRTAAGTRTLDGGSLQVLRPRVYYRGGRGLRAASFALAMSGVLCSQRHWADLIYSRFLGESALVTCLLKAMGVLQQPLCVTPAAAGGAYGDARILRSLPLWQRWLPRLVQQCDAINVIADNIDAELDALDVPRERRTHIPNGVEPMPPRTRAIGDEGPLRLVTVGRLEHQKGHDVLLQALAREPLRSAAHTLDVIGDGSLREDLLAQARALGLGSRVRFHGALPHDRSIAMLAAADLFVLSSRYEGLSNAALEAMACGLPLVLTRCGGIDREVTADCGWTCPPDDVGALAASVAAACATSRARLDRMGLEARAIVESRYSIAATARQLLELFQALVARPR